MYIVLSDGREIDIPDCTDLVEFCEDCPRYMDDCDGNEYEKHGWSKEKTLQKDIKKIKIHKNEICYLLKYHEPMKPIYNDEKYGDHLPHCGNCEKVLPDNAVYGKVNFCHYCGQAVKRRMK